MIANDDHGMFVRSHGQSGRGTLVYIHGLGESSACFESILRHPGLRGWNHRAPDLPGYGRSRWPTTPLSLSAQAELLANWIGERFEEPVVLIGHSMGGVSGLFLCELRPDRIRGFLNVEGNLSIEDCTYSRRAIEYDEEAFERTGFAELLADVERRGETDASFRGYHDSMKRCDPRLFHRNSRELVEHSSHEGLPRRLAALDLPVLHLSGVPGGAGDHSRALLTTAGVRWKVIEPAGHWPFIDQPDRFVAEVREWLDRLEGGPP